MQIRYEDMTVEKLLIKDYFKEIFLSLNSIHGLADIKRLIKSFETTFANYIGTNYALAVNSGSDALQLSLLSLNIGKGDSVIIPNLTYPAVPLSIIYTGAEPIFIEIKEDDLEINPLLIEKNIKNNTKAMIIPHMFGRPAALDKILKITKKYNLYLIEDCCQAESSEYKGKKLGSFGDLACFSFSYYKPLSSCGGAGGMICFNNEQYLKIKEYQNINNDSQLLISAQKRFAPLSLLDLISIKTKFKNLKNIIHSRLEIKNIYEQSLSKIKEIKIFKDLPETLSIPQNFVILTKRRDQLGQYLKNHSVSWQEPYIPLHLMKIFKPFIHDSYPISETYYKEAIQLPLYSFLEKDKALYMVELIKNFIKID